STSCTCGHCRDGSTGTPGWRSSVSRPTSTNARPPRESRATASTKRCWIGASVHRRSSASTSNRRHPCPNETFSLKRQNHRSSDWWRALKRKQAESEHERAQVIVRGAELGLGARCLVAT